MKRLISLTMSALAVFAAMCACEKDPQGATSDVTPEISASPASVTFAAAGETKNIAVTTNVDDWSYSGQPDWVTVVADGKELKLTATANPSTTDERSGTLKLTAGEADFSVELKQPKGEKYPGYVELTDCEMIYYGSLYQAFIPGCEGGSASISLGSTDGRTEMYLDIFTDEYLTAEEVVVPEGEFTKGDSYEEYVNLNISGTPMTYIEGGTYVISDEEGDEEFSGGSSITYTTGDASETDYIVDGKFTISRNDDGTYLIKTDLKDADGNDLKYYYEGELEFDVTEAMFPVVGEIDPTVIESVSCSYKGDSGAGTTALSLTLYAESGAMTSIEFYVASTTFEDLNIEGMYSAPEGENSCEAGTLCKGAMLEMEGFSFPIGTYIMFNFGDYFVADGASMLLITRDEGADTYTVMANLMNVAEEGYLFMVEGAEIEFFDETAYDDEEW